MGLRVNEQEAAEFVSSEIFKSYQLNQLDWDEFEEEEVGAFFCLFMRKGAAGLYQFYGPFPPDAEACIGIPASQGLGRYFLDWTPEAKSWFLAVDYTQSPLVSAAEMRRMAHYIEHDLALSWQRWSRTMKGATPPFYNGRRSVPR